MKDQAYNGKDFISVINFLTKFKRAYDSSRIHCGAAVWQFRKFTSGPALADIKARSTLLSNDANRHKGTITTYVEVVNHVLRRYATDAVIAKADEEIRNFKQGSVTPFDFS